MLKLRLACMGVLACGACSPDPGVDEDDASESSGTPEPSVSESESSSGTTDVPPSREDSTGPDTGTSETGEPTSLRCLAIVGLPVKPDESIEGFADLDGDGMRELIVAGEDGTVSIFAADESPGPWTLRQSLEGTDHVHDMGDIDGDGLEDLVAGSLEGADWWRSDADGELALKAALGSGWLEDRRVLLPDGAGGAADVAEIVDGELVLSRGIGDGTFVAETVFGAPDAHVGLLEPILRTRGGVLLPTRLKLDCVGACGDGRQVVTVDDALLATAQYAVFGAIVDVLLVDDDATLDAFTLTDGVLVLDVDGSDTVTFTNDAAAAQVGDFDGDGFTDLALLEGDTGSVRWGEGEGESWSASEPLPSTAPDGVVAPERAVDVDGDGRDELVVGEAGRHALVFMEPC